MEYLYDMINFVEKEFGDMAKNGKFRNRDDIEIAYKCMDIAKDAFCIMEYEDKMQGDNYSEYGMYPYSRGMGAKRNSLGQYSREGNNYHNGNSNNPYMRARRTMGYSRANAKEEFLDNLYDMMEQAPDDKTRAHFQRMIQEMEMEQ